MDLYDPKLHKLVKYEDLVRSPVDILRSLLKFIGGPQLSTEEISAFWEEHHKADKLKTGEPGHAKAEINVGDLLRAWRGPVETEAKLKLIRQLRQNRRSEASEPDLAFTRYYNTYREPDFNPEHWRKEISQELLNATEREPICQKVLKMLMYV